ncbi:MAG: hypothetical protein J6J20_07615 [Muribaculaceae bacterium]|nr:hypothetical protein [Muribaculaceae bacterium]
MKKILFLILLPAMLAPAVYAQTEAEMEELRQQVLYYKKCFPKKSVLATTSTNYITDAGKVVPVKIRSDFGAENFVQMDGGLKKVNFMFGDSGDDYINRNIEDIFDDYAECSPAFHVVGHSIADPNGSAQTIRMGGMDLNAKEVAEIIIKQLEGYEHILNAEERPFPVVIHSCNAGKGDNSFAEQLSRHLAESILDVRVIAPSGVLYSERMTERDLKDGSTRTVYTEKVAGTSGFTTGADAGTWEVFTNGKCSHGRKDYKSTVREVR